MLGTALYFGWVYSEVVLVGNCASTIHRSMANIHAVQCVIIWILLYYNFKTPPFLDIPNGWMPFLSSTATCGLGKPLLENGYFFTAYSILRLRCSKLEEQRKLRRLNGNGAFMKPLIDSENTDTKKKVFLWNSTSNAFFYIFFLFCQFPPWMSLIPKVCYKKPKGTF